VAEFFGILFGAIRSQSTANRPGHGRDGYYFTSTEEFAWIEMAAVIGDTLYQAGRIKDPNPSSFTDAELAEFFPDVRVQS
jgi:hypothetical protein